MLAYCFDENEILPRKRFVKNTVVGMTAVFLVIHIGSTNLYQGNELRKRRIRMTSL